MSQASYAPNEYDIVTIKWKKAVVVKMGIVMKIILWSWIWAECGKLGNNVRIIIHSLICIANNSISLVGHLHKTDRFIVTGIPNVNTHLDGLVVQDCSIPIANTLEILWSCTKTSTCWYSFDVNCRDDAYMAYAQFWWSGNTCYMWDAIRVDIACLQEVLIYMICLFFSLKCTIHLLNQHQHHHSWFYIKIRRIPMSAVITAWPA